MNTTQKKQGSTSNKIFTLWIPARKTIKKGEASPSNVMFPARPRSNSRCHMASMGSCTYLENLDQRIHGAVLEVVGDHINSLTKDPESRNIYQVYVVLPIARLYTTYIYLPPLVRTRNIQHTLHRNGFFPSSVAPPVCSIPRCLR